MLELVCLRVKGRAENVHGSFLHKGKQQLKKTASSHFVMLLCSGVWSPHRSKTSAEVRTAARTLSCTAARTLSCTAAVMQLQLHVPSQHPSAGGRAAPEMQAKQEARTGILHRGNQLAKEAQGKLDLDACVSRLPACGAEGGGDVCSG